MNGWTRWARRVVAMAVIGTVSAVVAVGPARVAGARILEHPIVGMQSTPDGHGYWEVASDGGIFSFGDAGYYGSMGGQPLHAPVVAMASTPDGKGYWEVASDGGIFSFGNAGFYGSMGGTPLNQPIVGLAATPDGKGYWEVASDGGLFSFGDAEFYGSMGGTALNQPVVAMASTPDGKGYWEVASDGGLFSFGDAEFYGSMGGTPLNEPIVGMASTPDGKGYWEVAADGGMFSFGDAAFYGSMGATPLNRPIVGLATVPKGKGYWEAASDGGIFSFGDVRFFGSVPNLPPPGPPRIALYGDSLGMEAGPYFTYLAGQAGASTLVRTYGGLSPCDFLSDMATDAASWQPTAVVLEFSGDNFTPCMDGDPIGSQQYYAKYQSDLQSAIDIFRPAGTEVFIVGLPYDESAGLNQNVTKLNQLYASVASANSGVTYVDAGQSVMAKGAFAWSLPCLPYEPCTGTAGTNIVRSPDGVHFCPTGDTTLERYFEICNVYSSGAFRFAAAMLGPALDS